MGSCRESDQWQGVGWGIEDLNEGMFVRIERGEEIREDRRG